MHRSLCLCGPFVAALAWAAGPAVGQCEQFKLVASDGEEFDQYGVSVAASGDIAVVGAALDDVDGILNAGSAYVYRRGDDGWVEEQQLVASDPQQLDEFGKAVGVSGDVVLVGVWSEDETADHAGAAYIFQLDDDSWTEQQKLLASDGAENDLFGEAVAIDGEVALIGARLRDDPVEAAGAVYVFRRNLDEWIETRKLLASDAVRRDEFGTAIALSGGVAVIGAPKVDDNGNDSGAAYVFRWDGASWIEEQKLLASDGSAGAFMGRAVAVSGDVAIIGAEIDSNENGTAAGAAYVFRYDGESWQEERKLIASDGASNDLFGTSVAVSGDLAVVGSVLDDDGGPNSGSLYLYQRVGETTWLEEHKLTPHDGAPNDRFGVSAVIVPGFAVAGAFLHDGVGEQSGAAFAFDLSFCICPDFNEDGMVGFDDLLRVLRAWGQDGGPEDLDGSGIVGFGDVLKLLSLWGPCPS